MPGRVFLTTPLADIARELSAPVPDFDDDGARLNIAPGQNVTALTSDGLTRMRWGMIPVGRVNARGRPVLETIVNARSETVFDKSAFKGVGRAVVPVDGWYEWTGEKRRKKPWRIQRLDRGLMYFAAIKDRWVAPGGTEIHQLATVTCEPNADVKKVHHRMAVILSAGDVCTWLTAPEQDLAPMMVPLENGQLGIEPADDVDWSGP